MLHRHHIKPRHMGGDNHPSNLIDLTVEEHADAHKKLWEEHGKEEDRIAWLCLSGQITADQARRQTTSLIWKGKQLPQEMREKISKTLTGRVRPEWEKEKIRGFKHTPEAIEKIRIAGTGRKHTDKARNAIKVARSKPVMTEYGQFPSILEAAKYMMNLTGKSLESCRWYIRNNSQVI